MLRARAAGYLDRTVALAPEGPEQTVDLWPLGEPVRGRAVTPGGEGIQGVAVQLVGAGLTQTSATGERGEFEFPRPPAGRGTLRIEAVGRTPAVEVLEIPRYGTASADSLRVVLALPPTLRGRVVSSGGEAVAGARVTLGSPEEPIEEAASDEEGRFAVRAPGGGTYDLMFESEGYATTYLRAEVGADERELDLGEILLTTPLEVGGKVVDREGNPVAEVVIYLSPVPAQWRRGGEGRPRRQPMARSSRGGEFYLELEEGRTYEAEAWKRGYAPRTERFTALSGAEELTLALEAAVELRVLTRDETGAPLPEVQLSMTLADGAGLPLRMNGSSAGARTDAEGTFTFPAVPLGARLRVEGLPRDLRYAPEAREVETSETGEALEVVLIHGPAGMLTGRVVSRDGEPIHGARVEAVPAGSPRASSPYWQSVADADGRYELFALPLGPAELRVSHAAYEPRRVGVVLAPGEVERDVVLEPRPQSRLEGRLSLPSGEPLAGVQVGLDRRENGWRSLDKLAATGPDGRFDFEELPAGVYRLRLETGFQLAEPEAQYSILSDPVAVEVIAQRPCRVTGYLQDVETGGEPVAVRLSGPGGRQVLGSADPQTGVLSIAPLYPGVWRLEASVGETVRSWEVECSEPGGETAVVLE